MIREFSSFVYSFLENLFNVRAVLSFVLVFILPGMAWSLLFFEQQRVFERIVFSFILSAVTVTLGIVFFNKLLGVRITGLSAFIIIILVTAIPVLVYFINRTLKRKKDKPRETGSKYYRPLASK